MKIVKRYKNERKNYTIRINKKGKYFIYRLTNRTEIDCVNLKDAVWLLYCLTH